MKKLFFTISLLVWVLMPLVSFAQQLPDEIEDEILKKLGDTGPDRQYQVAILEEPIGNTQFEKQIFRETVCDVDAVTKDIRCLTLAKLTTDCLSREKNWTSPVKPQPGDKKIICDEVYVVVGIGGLDLLKGFIRNIYVWGASVVGLVAVLRIVIAGVEISTSQGEGRLSDAKGKIFQSIASIVLLFLSAVILYTVNPNFFT